MDSHTSTPRRRRFARPLHFTRLGTFYVLFSIALGAAAINTGNNLLYVVLGILLGFIIISGLLSDSTLWGFDTRCAVHERLFAAQTSVLSLSVVKRGFPAIGVTVTPEWEFVGLGVSQSLDWASQERVDAYESPVTPARRGILRLRALRYQTRFPFGLFEKSYREPREEAWVVYPRIQTWAPWPGLTVDQTGWKAASGRSGLGNIPYLLREFRAGDSRRQIDWKATAKRQEFIVREMEEEGHPTRRFVVPAWPPGLSTTEEEDLISFVASVVYYFYGRGESVEVSLPGNQFHCDSNWTAFDAVMNHLALLDTAQAQGQKIERHPDDVDLMALWTSQRA